METRVKITYIPTESIEEFGSFKISFIDFNGALRSTGLKFNPKALWSFARDSSFYYI